MANARLLYIGGKLDAANEIRKIDVHEAAIDLLARKAVHVCIKLEQVTTFAANILKQEMLSKGGDAAVCRGVADFSVTHSDVILMGTLAQLYRLTEKLDCQKGCFCEIGAQISAILDNIEDDSAKSFCFKDCSLPLGKKTYIMGILNVTPDSFSDGGQYNNVEAAFKRAAKMIENGADIIDIGGESTRPGYVAVSPEEEIERIVPIIKALKSKFSIPVSVDTYKAAVAAKALAAGADIINDIWGLQKDPAMAKLVSEYSAGVILMHNGDKEISGDIMGNVIGFLRNSIDIAIKAGIPKENIMVDPGVGFCKTQDQNLEVVRRLNELKSLGLPVLLGTSRKSIIGKVLNLPVDERLMGTAATVALGIEKGADVVRVHDVAEMSLLCKMTDAIIRKQV